MPTPTKEQIIHRASEIWEKNDKPRADEEFYHQAEQELQEAGEPQKRWNKTSHKRSKE